MSHPNLKKLATRIHAANKAAGWWDIPRSSVQTAWLVVTELAEATEAERAGKYADLEAFEGMLKTHVDISKDRNHVPEGNEGTYLSAVWPAVFKRHIKDSFEDKIAYAVIRLLDFAGSEGVELKLYERHLNPDVENESVFFYVSELCFQAGRDSPRLGDDNISKAISSSISQLFALSKLRGFDLWHHVELKLKHNATRGKMHGGKKF